MTQCADKATGLYDVKRLAARMGVRPSTIRSMKSRGTIPSPTCNDINGGAVWTEEVIDNFLQEKHTPIDHNIKYNDKLPAVIDLFSGCGGMSLGFERSGFRVIAGFDNWVEAVENYNNNLGHDAFVLDLSNVDASIQMLSKFFETEKPAIIGGPPCQDFSSAGKRKEGARADLTENYAEIVAHFRPPFFVMENVDRVEKSYAFQRAKQILIDAGYFVNYVILNASQCGVPQNRRRLITFGSFSAPITERVIESLENNVSKHKTTVRDWFGDKLDTNYYYRHPRSYARRAIFSVDEPSPTIRGVNRPIPDGYPGHKGDPASISEARPLTTRERASIQTFPESFNFTGSKTNVEQMIGNAVPVLLAEYIAKHISSTLLDYKYSKDAES
ncbi:MAG: DNA cytosine methyltransferase [Eubacteriales bacterium]|nr:DNA cytosine methyltransferase [Eubacteriales bacterium]